MQVFINSSSSGTAASIKTTLSTTDATVTTIDTVPIPTDQIVILTAKVVSKKDDLTLTGYYDIICGYTNNSGTVTINGGGVVNYQDRQTPAGWNVTFVISGTNVLIRVKGAAATNVDWKCARQTLKV